MYLKPIENSQGTYYGEFQIFYFDGAGNKVILDERHIDSGEEKLNYTKAKEEYNNALNSYLVKSILLVSTWGGELELYDPKTNSQSIWR